MCLARKEDLKIKFAVPALKLNDRVKMKTCRFGVKYAKEKSKFTYGTVSAIDGGKIADVKWETKEGEPVAMSAHVSHLQRVSPILKVLSRIMNGKGSQSRKAVNQYWRWEVNSPFPTQTKMEIGLRISSRL